MLALRACAEALRYAPAVVLAIVAGYSEARSAGLLALRSYSGCWRLRYRAADDGSWRAAWQGIPDPAGFAEPMFASEETAGGALGVARSVGGGVVLTRFDVARNSWQSRVAPGAAPMEHILSVAANDEFVFAMGRPSMAASSCVSQAYDRARNEWLILPKSAARYGHSMTASASQLYVIGGFAACGRMCHVLDLGPLCGLGGHPGPLLPSVPSQPSNPTPADGRPLARPLVHPLAWRTAPDLPMARYLHASILVGTTLYVMGGRDGASRPVADVCQLDTLRCEAWLLSVWRLPRLITNLAVHVTSDGTVIIADILTRGTQEIVPSATCYGGRPGAPWSELPHVPRVGAEFP